jgi:hypothetical protein
LKNGTLVVKLGIYPEDYFTGLVVSDILSGDKHKGWFAVRMDQQIEETGDRNVMFHLRNVFGLKPDDVIQVYIWNLNKESVRIDDVEVKFYDEF